MKRVLPLALGPSLASSFTRQLLVALGMEELGPFKIYPATDLEFPGFSFIQPITTSHISGHYFSTPRNQPHIHIDIYSCKYFDWAEVIRIADKFFSLDDWTANFIVREHGAGRGCEEISGHSGVILEKTRLAPTAALMSA